MSDNKDYFSDYGMWDLGGYSLPVDSTYRVAWRRMAATTGFRTLYPALIPPGTKHVHTVISAGKPENASEVVLAGAVLSSLLVDFRVRCGNASEIQPSQAQLLPIKIEKSLREPMMTRYLKLNCLTDAYAPLWNELMESEWTWETALRNALERLHAQLEIDVMAAISFGVSSGELCMIYRTQFPIMRRYDQETYFDQTGRQIPKSVLKNLPTNSDNVVDSQPPHSWNHPESGKNYRIIFPLQTLDRELEIQKKYDQLLELLSHSESSA